MERHVYRFAGHAVEINSLHSQVHEMCREYRAEARPELILTIRQRDIDEERLRSQSAAAAEAFKEAPEPSPKASASPAASREASQAFQQKEDCTAEASGEAAEASQKEGGSREAGQAFQQKEDCTAEASGVETCSREANHCEVSDREASHPASPAYPASPSSSASPPSPGRDAYLETLAVYRKLAEGLVDRGILLFHSSAVAVDGACYLFAARSGMGKSTHACFWRELLGERAVMVNDDKPLLEIGPEGVRVWGTPWDGKHHLSSNISVPLRAVCLLERGENAIWPITAREAWPALWRQSYRPSDPEKLKRTLQLTDALSRSARFYRLRCMPELEAARLAYAALCKGELPRS